MIALAKGVGLPDNFERTTGIGRENHIVFGRVGVEILEHVSASGFDEMSRRQRGRVGRVWVAKGVLQQNLLVLFNLRFGVEAAASVIQIDVFGTVQAAIIFGAQPVDVGRRFVGGVFFQEICVSGVH